MNSQPTVLHSHTYEVSLDDAGLTGLLPALTPSGVWIRQRQGLLGLGVAAEFTASGPRRFAELAQSWAAVDWQPLESPHGPVSAAFAEAAHYPGAGPVAFTSVAFSETSSYASRLIVPQLILAVSAERSLLTVVGDSAAADVTTLLTEHGLVLDGGTVRLLDTAAVPRILPAGQLQAGSQSERQYLNAVTAGLSAIAAGTVQKLVLARDVVVASSQPLPRGVLLSRLVADYAECWTYCVGEVSGGNESVLGATPEMLVSLRGERVSSRVLAGTVDRSWSEQEAADRLLRNAKQHREHDLAVQSLVEQLSPLTESLQSPTDPHVLRLPNVYHLATDVSGVLAPGREGSLPSPLQVAERAHPTAAVCGTPTREAGQLLEMLEGLDRGPFAGPVGWMDAAGNADFGIALRGGVLEGPCSTTHDGGDAAAAENGNGGRRIRLYAGCGIVADSVPEDELAETRSKLRPMLSTLGLVAS